MEKMIVVVFDDELKALEGFRALKELDRKGEISIHEAQAIAKGSTGAVRVVDNADMLSFPLIGGGTVVKTTQEDLDAAAHRAEMEQLKLERKQARSDRLEKIDARIDHLREKLEKAIERKRAKMRLRQQQREAKIQALQTKANQSEGEVRQRQEARIAELRSDYAEKAVVG